MLLWIAMALLAAAASLAVLVPLYRGRNAALPAGPAEVEIYKDQLGEVERDLSRGIIEPREANAARTEISRRLLRADAEAAAPPAGSERPRRVVAVAAVVAMPAVALGLYLLIGSPELPDQPLAARLESPAEGDSVAVLVARVEAHLATNPDDGRGWEVIAPVYARAGRYADAVRAYASAIRILGSTAGRETGLGDALVRTSEGVVTDEARAAFERAARLDRSAVRPRFYLAIALSQEGRKPEAVAAWQALLKDAPADAPWAPAARNALAELQGAPAPGPTAADVDATAKLAPADQRAMIEGMVSQLAARLGAEPGDAEGWARLIRSYMVLGRKDDAATALQKARAALAGKAGQLAIVEDAARSAGLVE